MDKQKIINLNINPQVQSEKESNKKDSELPNTCGFFQTNPISKMLFANIINKKDKFKLKDLFR